MTYQSGFDAGERDAFKDRQNGLRRVFEDMPRGEYQRGYFDGYTPRNLEWAARRPEGQAWTND